MEEFDDDDDVQGSPPRPPARRSTLSHHHVTMTQNELQELIALSVRQTLVQLGIDGDNPIEMQRDFQHLREWRKAGEDLRSKGLMTLWGLFIAGAVALLLVGVKNWFHQS